MNICDTTLKIFNTMSKTKQEFIPINKDVVKMYACGITVSGDAHLGHAYQAYIYDIIRKYLIKKGYNVIYVRNYTDIDDKIINKSKEYNMPALDFAKMMMDRIDNDMKAFDIDNPDIYIKATECIHDIIDFIQQLLNQDYAYVTNVGNVYFNVSKFKNYGCLSHRDTFYSINSVRITNEEDKKNILDFALWKSSKEGEPYWESPWGNGRPGWHIECSTMIKKVFGLDTIDIHGGGADLIFPHHENELAQSEALLNKTFVKYWIHNGLIKINGQKMSKSLGNSILLKDVLNKYPAEVLKYVMLLFHYRSDINIDEKSLDNAYKQLYKFYSLIYKITNNKKTTEIYSNSINEDFNKAMDDDFNTALAMSNLHKYFKKIKQNDNENENICLINSIIETYSLFGLFKSNAQDFIKQYENKYINNNIPQNIIELANNMQQERLNKNYNVSDQLKKTILDMGYNIQINKDNTYTLIKIK